MNIIRIGNKTETSRFEISIQKSHQLFSIVFNTHQWKWINDTLGSHRTETIYYGIVFVLNPLFFEIRIIVTPFKKIITKK